MASATQEAEATAVLDAYVQVSQTVRNVVLDQVLAAWDRLTSWRDADITAFAELVVPKVLGGQDRMSALTAAYLNRTIALEIGHQFRPIPVPTVDTTGAVVRNGTKPIEVYSRPGPTIWRALQQGDSLEQAVSKGRDRLVSMTQSDIQLSKTWSAQKVISQSPSIIVGYRRVLTGKSSCALCVVASTRIYHKEALMPMHPGCDCTVGEVFQHQAANHGDERAVLSAAHNEIQSRLGVDTNKAEQLRQLTIVHQHGELGPLLAVRDQHFTGPSDIS